MNIKPRTKWMVLALLFLLALVTMFSLRHVERFAVAEPQLLVDAQFAQADRFWHLKGSEEVSFNDSQLSIANSVGASQSVWQNVVVDTPVFIRFEYVGAAHRITPGEEEWARGTGGVIYRDHDGERVDSKLVGTFEGTAGSTFITHTEKLRAHLGSIDVTFRLLRSGGKFVVTEPVLSLLYERPVYKGIKYLIVFFWLTAFLSLSLFALQFIKPIQIVSLAFISTLVVLGALLPEYLMVAINQKIALMFPESLLTGVRSVLSSVFGIDFKTPGAEISKFGHFLGFAVLGVLVGGFYQRIGVLFALAALAVFALLTEALQLMVGGRTPRLADFFLDVSGGVVGMLIGITCVSAYLAVRSMGRQPDDTHTEPATDTSNENN